MNENEIIVGLLNLSKDVEFRQESERQALPWEPGHPWWLPPVGAARWSSLPCAKGDERAGGTLLPLWFISRDGLFLDT